MDDAEDMYDEDNDPFDLEQLASCEGGGENMTMRKMTTYRQTMSKGLVIGMLMQRYW